MLKGHSVEVLLRTYVRFLIHRVCSLENLSMLIESKILNH